MVVESVPGHYGFIDISMIENTNSTTIAEAKEKNRALVLKLRERFYYRVRCIISDLVNYLTDCKFFCRILMIWK